MEIISMYNLKGGVGKTTSTHSIASALNELGKKVLVIDIDPQSSLTFLITDAELEVTTKDVLLDNKTLDECILVGESFDYIGSTLELTFAELELNAEYSKEYSLKRAIDASSLEENYDYVLIDCPPSMGVFTLNALTASDSIIIPCQCELLSLKGLSILFEALRIPTKKLNKNLKVRGILPTMLDNRKSVSKSIYDMIKESYDEHRVFTPIRTNSKLCDLGIEKKSIFEIDKKSNGAKDYMDVAKEIVNG